MSEKADTLDVAAAEELEKQYDTTLSHREHSPLLRRLLFGFTLLFAFYHYITAGIGLPVDYWHMGIHMAGLFVLIFTGFPLRRNDKTMAYRPNSWWIISNVPIYDWACILLGVMAALYEVERSGKGQIVDVGMVDLGCGALLHGVGQQSRRHALHDAFRSRQQGDFGSGDA